MITKILVGIVGSENSKKALDYALEIARKLRFNSYIITDAKN